jgi:pSer/pThr/pTyr-binding forkhead associated (FHA) protein
VAIGRHSSCQLAIRREDISRRHAEVRYEDNRFVIRDFGSTNGTFVNERRLEGVRALSPGDRIEVGSSTITFCEIENDLSGGTGFDDSGEAKTMIALRPPTSVGGGSSGAFLGDLAELPPFCLFQVLEMGGKSGLLEVHSDDITGRMWFENGNPIHAETEKQMGFDAALSIAGIATGQFRFEPQIGSQETTIRASVTELLLEACRQQDEEGQ